MKTLTQAQYQTLQAIEQFIENNQMAPTLRELMAIHKLKSPCPVQARVNGLAEAGAISIVAQKARTIRVLIPSSEWSVDARLGRKVSEARS